MKILGAILLFDEKSCDVFIRDSDELPVGVGTAVVVDMPPCQSELSVLAPKLYPLKATRLDVYDR